MKIFISLLIFAFILHPLPSPAETFSLPRSDGSKILFYLDVPKSDHFPILIGFQGSQCVSSFSMHEMLKSALIPRGIAVLSLEKRGLTSEAKSCPEEYKQKNTPQDRVHDHLQVIDFLRTNQNRWNHRLGLAGGSEGGMVAALIAPQIPEAKTLTLLASGGGLTMGDELLFLSKKKLQMQAATSQQIETNRAQLIHQFAVMKADPSSDKQWLSDGKAAINTYKWWASILEVRLLPYLLQLKIPIYMAHGTADSSCPIESADLLVQAFAERKKANIIFKRYAGLEHNWTDAQKQHHPEVLTDAMRWIVENLH